jgi:hypothetical protein
MFMGVIGVGYWNFNQNVQSTANGPNSMDMIGFGF